MRLYYDKYTNIESWEHLYKLFCNFSNGVENLSISLETIELHNVSCNVKSLKDVSYHGINDANNQRERDLNTQRFLTPRIKCFED